MNSNADPRGGRNGQVQEVLGAGEEFPRMGDGALAPRVILAGWAILHVTLSDGRRQILSVVLPGDGVGLFAPEHPLNRVQARALTSLRLAEPLHSDESSAAAPRTFFGAIAQQECSLLDHIVRLGRQTAYERTIHLMLEMHDRLTTSGLTHDGAFDFPLTQELLADALGLSTVHVNRVLRRLRREGMIAMKDRRLTLFDRTRMRSICDYSYSFVSNSFTDAQAMPRAATYSRESATSRPEAEAR